MTDKRAGRKRIPEKEKRFGVVFSLTKHESDEVDRIAKKLGLRSRSALIQMMIQREANR